MKLRSGKLVQPNTEEIVLEYHTENDRHLSFMETVKRIGSTGVWWPGMFSDVMAVVRLCPCRQVKQHPIVIDLEEDTVSEAVDDEASKVEQVSDDDAHPHIMVEEEPTFEEVSEEDEHALIMAKKEPIVIDLTLDEESPDTESTFPSESDSVFMSFDGSIGFTAEEANDYSDTVRSLRQKLFYYSSVEKHCINTKASDRSFVQNEIIASFANIRRISGIEKRYLVTISKYQQLQAATHLLRTYSNDWEQYLCDEYPLYVNFD
jgi:hypothetical protein